MNTARSSVWMARKWLCIAWVGLPLGAFAATGTTTVPAGHARFEFLTPSLVRMEYSASARFVNAPTAVVHKRKWPRVDVTSERANGWLVVSTGAMTLRYRLGSGDFRATNLEVAWKDAGVTHTWHPGQPDHGNLGGLTYSLDNVSAKNLPASGNDLESPVDDVIPGIDVLLPKAKPGLLSRSDFAFIDDSHTPVWSAAMQWIAPRRAKGDQDWYLFTYPHHDYKEVLREYAELCGPIPMIPRYVLGPMITDLNFAYFPGNPEDKTAAFSSYGAKHLEGEVMRFRQNHIPLDTLVLDFGWHDYGWQGGYDWSPLIPHPDAFLEWMRAHGIKVALNDHPGYANTRESILSHNDTHAPAVLKALGRPLPPKPSFNLDLSTGWSLATDPHDVGIDQHWYAMNHGAAEWEPIRTDASLSAQGLGHYTGIVWYRTTVHLPSHLPPRLYLYLSEQSKDYQLYIDGRRASHSHVRWPRRLTWADITPYVKAGQTVYIVVRLQPDEYGSGFLRGVEAIRNIRPPKRIYFNLANRKQASVSMRYLHAPLLKHGVSFWWVDGGSGAAEMPGLNPQLWTNRVFYDDAQRVTGHRSFILSRYGGWGSERYPAYFTGDTYSQWPVLAYEAAYMVRGGNVLIPYMSDDIGGFHGGKIPFELYARWVEFGAFSPILRMHSAHENPTQGNLRMPWIYGNRGIALVREYFTLHTQLIPYTYTYAWIAHKKALPILRPLYLRSPDSNESYQHPHEYYFGSEMLVAPVLDASGDRTVYLPPGTWIGFFNGKRYHGGTSFKARYATDQTPVFVHDGAIIPEQPADFAWSNAQPLDHLIINVYGTAEGAFDLYEDDGESMGYEDGEYALTPMRYARKGHGAHQVTIGPTEGTFRGQVHRRSCEMEVHGIDRPASVSVDGKATERWTWDATDATATIEVPAHSIRNRVTVEWRSTKT